jgi:hypothetical protein
MSDRLKEIGERFEDYAEPAKQDIALLYVMECENENLREHVRQINEQLDIYLS